MPIHGPNASRMAMLAAAPLVAALAIVFVASCSDTHPFAPRAARHGVLADSVPPSPPPVVFVGAGDIAGCTSKGGLKAGTIGTAALLDSIPGTVFTIGDDAYEFGSASDFANCYDPSWGRQKARTYPSIGNHEYDLGTPQAYFDYFGPIAGDPTRGYYSFDLGAWHIVMLNSNQDYVPTKTGSPQELWLKADLAASTKRCTIAIWHHPRFYSNDAPSAPGVRGYVKGFWDDLYAAGAEIVLNAHNHFYERYAPMTPDGAVDTVRGLREFIVGTGGKSISDPTSISPTSEVHNGSTYGVIKLTLDTASYTWRFIPIAGQTFTDSGSGQCH